MTPQWELAARLILSLAAVVVVATIADDEHPLRATWRGRVLLTLAAVSILAYFNFGRFHRPTFVHYSEMFHYALGAKYFPELGYDGLYVASLEAMSESRPDWPLPVQIRDLRDKTITPTGSLEAQRQAVKARFTPARWQAFVHDNETFLRPEFKDFIPRMLLDHGFNPPPPWVFFGRLVTRFIPLTWTTLVLLALLDPLLVGLAFWMVWRAFGSRVAAVGLVVFGLGYGWNYNWVGGALLRYDWFLAVAASICLLRERRSFGAGVALAAASALRIFPALLLAPLVPVAVRRMTRREPFGSLRRLAAGLVLGGTAMFVLGSVAGRGLGAWGEFAATIRHQEDTWATNDVGLKLCVLYSPDTSTGRLPRNASFKTRWETWQAWMNRAERERRPLFLAAATLTIGIVGLAAWRARPSTAVMMGTAVAFAALVLTCYYWVMLALLPTVRVRGPAVALLVLNALLCALELANVSSQILFGAMCWGVLATLLVTLVPPALATLRGVNT